MELIQKLIDFRCKETFLCICGKSDTNLPTCEEKNQPINATSVAIINIGRKMAKEFGNLNLLKKRYRGSNTMLIKKAITNGITILLARMISATIKKTPSNSIDLLTVIGISFICFNL